MSVKVWCYAGYKYPERPTAFLYEGRKLTVHKVQSTWKTEDSENFLVHTTYGKEIVLIYNPSEDKWNLQEMDKSDE